MNQKYIDYLQKTLTFKPTNAGSHLKDIYEYDPQAQDLVKVKTIDFQAYIDSFEFETNYKETIQNALGGHAYNEKILKHYAPTGSEMYGDFTQASNDIIENIDLANQTYDEYIQFNESEQTKPKEITKNE
jgi:hypothetical protein